MIRAKLVLRNVISKPLRTAIIILSLAAAAFASLFCISGIRTVQNDMYDFFRSNYGDVDLMMINGKNNIRVTENDLPPGSRIIQRSMGKVNYTVPNDRFFNYVQNTEISIIGMDTKLAYEMHIFEKPYSTDGGITITQNLAAIIDKGIGDEFTFTGDEGKKYTMKILDIAPSTRFFSSAPVSMLMSQEKCWEVTGSKKGSAFLAYADLPDEIVAETTDMLMQKYPDHSFMGTASLDSDETMASMLSIYYLIFAVVFLMVCFIVVSMSKHIVNERMSVIGMLRSIGGSITGTGMLLMSESIFYGISGGLIGSLLFLPFRSGALLSMFVPANPDGSEMTRTEVISPLTVIAVILVVTLVQCVFSAGAIIKASKTPVRDIIFGTKESAYLPSKVLTIFGFILIALGIILFAAFEDFVMLIAAAFCSTIGAVMIFPIIISLLSRLLSSMFTAMKKPVAKLAAKEIATTKSSVSSAQIILSALSLTIAMFVIAVSLLNFIDSRIYDANIIITLPQQEGKHYDYAIKNIDGVTDVECLYYQSLMYDTKAMVNGEERELYVVGLPDGGFRNFTGISDCPQKLGENEIAVDKILAKKLSLNIGDEMIIKLNIEKYLPKEFKLKISHIVDGGRFNSLGNTVLISLDNYKSVYFDYPTMVLVKNQPEKTMDIMSMMNSTLGDDLTGIKTIEDYILEQRSYMESILNIVYAVMVLGLALSLLGTSSNIMMGFEQSRRKFAVYYSTSLSKGGLKKLILTETVLTCGISALASVIFGLYFLYICNKALTTLNMSVPLTDPLLYSLLFGVIAFFVLLTSALKPVAELGKMNIAEEIKTSAD